MNKKEEKQWQEQIISMRNTVQEMELKTRFWKAEYEMKDYYLKNRDIQESYNKAYSEDMEKEKAARTELAKLMEDKAKLMENLARLSETKDVESKQDESLPVSNTI